MTLAFPNRTRTFDNTSQLIRFAGYDQLMLIRFSISTSVLGELSPKSTEKDCDYLALFDTLRTRIEKVAIKIYNKGKNSQNELEIQMF